MQHARTRQPRLLRPGLCVMAMAAAAVVALATPHGASAACIASVTYQGVPYLGSVMPEGGVGGGPVGPGVVPACNDVIIFPPSPGPPELPTVVRLHRVPGVAPRFAVATPGTGGALYMPATSPCRTRSIETVVSCLRQRTQRYVSGPSLIAPPSARAGAVIGLGIRVEDAARRGQPTSGLDALLQQRDPGGAWRSLFHLTAAIGGGDPPAPVAVGAHGFAVPAIGVIGGAPRTVRLPDVAPGAYRLAKRVSLGRTSRWLVSDLTILAP